MMSNKGIVCFLYSYISKTYGFVKKSSLYLNFWRKYDNFLMISWRPFWILHDDDSHTIFMCFIVIFDTENIGFSEQNQVSISNIEENMITLVISWRPIWILHDNNVE